MVVSHLWVRFNFLRREKKKQLHVVKLVDSDYLAVWAVERWEMDPSPTQCSSSVRTLVADSLP